MNPYKTSTDYNRLFELVSKGYEIDCARYVDQEKFPELLSGECARLVLVKEA